MSAYEQLAKPAPDVGPAVADGARLHDDVVVEAAKPSEEAVVAPAKAVAPAMMGTAAMNKRDAQRQAGNGNAVMGVVQRDSLAAADLLKIGSDFQSKCCLIKGGPPKNFLRRGLPMLFDERDFISYGESLRFIVVQGPCCFVFTDEADAHPLYVINLEDYKAIVEDPKKPDKDSYTVSPRTRNNEARETLVTILLKDKKTRKQAYQFSFDTANDNTVAKRFLDVLNRNNKLKPLNCEEVIFPTTSKKVAK